MAYIVTCLPLLWKPKISPTKNLILICDLCTTTRPVYLQEPAVLPLLKSPCKHCEALIQILHKNPAPVPWTVSWCYLNWFPLLFWDKFIFHNSTQCLGDLLLNHALTELSVRGWAVINHTRTLRCTDTHSPKDTTVTLIVSNFVYLNHHFFLWSPCAHTQKYNTHTPWQAGVWRS